ncbi:MAG: endonuclease III [Bdellovibrionia bacterium]
MTKLKGELPRSLKAKQQTAQLYIKLFQKYYPDAHCALDHKNAFELLIATILSAQCTDERVNMVTPALFKKFPTPQKMAKATQVEIEELIRSTGFFSNKAKNILQCCKTLVEVHKGEVPQDLEALVQLAGVGRKTANVVLGNAFNITSGIVVDTHVTRLAQRFGWVKSDNAVIIEREMQKFIPEEHWIMISHWLISHGRAVCKARKPDCSHCFLESHCPQRLD